ILLFPITGHAADRYPRHRLSTLCVACFAICPIALLTLSLHGLTSVYPIYAVLLFNGTVRAFIGPSNQALLPLLVRPEDFPNAVAWASSIFQGAMVAGPMAGGLLYTLAGGLPGVCALAAVLCLVSLGLMFFIRVDTPQRP